MIRRYLIILSALVLSSCSGKRINPESYHELHSMFLLMERMVDQKKEYLTMDLRFLESRYDESGVITEESPDFQVAQKVVEDVNIRIDYLKDWKNRLIEHSKGYDERGYLHNWDQKIVIENLAPEKPLVLENIPITGKKSLIIALIELSNLELNYLQNSSRQLRKYISELVEETGTELVFTGSIQSDLFNINGPVLWNFNKYRAEGIVVNGRLITTKDYSLEFTKPSWEKLLKDTLLIEVPLTWNDTTLVFNIHE